MRTEIRIAGSGGQGAITIGRILGSAAALREGREAVVTEGYSPSITGGWSRADVVISDDPVDYPLVARLDCLVAMYQEGLDMNYRLVKPTGVVITESQRVDASKLQEVGAVYHVAAATEAQALGKKVLANMVMLGALVGCTPIVSMKSIEETVEERFPRSAELNTKALHSGYDMVRSRPKA
jgi:2-oxoglutarate ferredoxin oxidoreductase subunit gamma